MDRWMSKEVLDLRNAVDQFRRVHGNIQIDWKKIRQEADLDRFTASQVRQKYSNLIKRKPNGQENSASTSASEQQTAIPFDKDANSLEEVKRIADAASKVKPYTATGLIFMDYLGYGENRGADRTLKRYLERLMTAVRTGMLSDKWVDELQNFGLDQSDHERQDYRDIAKLKKIQASHVSAEVAPEELDGRDSNSNYSATRDIGEPQEAPKPKKSKSDGQPNHGVNVSIFIAGNSPIAGPSGTSGVSSSALRQKEAEIAGSSCGSYCVSAGSSKQFMMSAPKKRITESSLYDKVVIGPMGYTLHIPQPGIGAHHKLRRLTDNEWRKIILEVRRSRFCILWDEESWKRLSERAGITCSHDGLKIQLDFCKFAIPRLQELMAPVDGILELDQQITEPCRLTDIIIFHSLISLEYKEILPTVESLAKMKCISVVDNSFLNWQMKFIDSVVDENNEYFECLEEDFMQLKNDITKQMRSQIRVMLKK